MMKVVVFLSFILEISGNNFDMYDYIIVGSGPAGAILANRLSAQPEVQVLLLEAGERSNMLTETPLLYPHIEKSPYDWNDTIHIPYYSGMDIKEKYIHLPQGRALGGSSIINSLLYVRGNEKDFNSWDWHGAKGWDWKNVFNMFIKSEKNINPEIANNGYHGKSGEVFVQYSTFSADQDEKYLQAATEVGHKLGDVNNGFQAVFDKPQFTIKDGRRWSVDKAFLEPILGRQNLKVLTSAFVRKVLIDNSISQGVEYEYKNRIRRAFIREEVILSAGVIRSPLLLMLSGIGPADQLQKYHLPVISDLPVGENLQDNPKIRYPIYNLRKLIVSERDFKNYLMSGQGILASTQAKAHGFFKTVYNEDGSWPDSEIIFVAEPSSNPEDVRGTVYCDNLVHRPRSRGRVRLSDDLNKNPIIEGNYLTEYNDVITLVEGLKMCLKLADTEALKNLGERIPPPDAIICDPYAINSDEYYRCLVMKMVQPSYNLVGTCKMGDPNDNTAVVDFNLKVRGIKRLRVADASIAPKLITGHTYALALMIGEKAADLILKDYYEKMGKWDFYMKK